MEVSDNDEFSEDSLGPLSPLTTFVPISSSLATESGFSFGDQFQTNKKKNKYSGASFKRRPLEDVTKETFNEMYER